jgi:signal transduction histidine kinase
VQQVLLLMAPHFEQEGFDVTLLADDLLPRVSLDADAFKQVLFNVLDNALKYGRGTAPHKLEVACKRVHDAVVVSVRDFGPGVAQGQLETIFEPFYRGEDELTRRRQGTGIGLALVRDLVALMGGRVHGENRAPGLEVRIALPMR